MRSGSPWRSARRLRHPSAQGRGTDFQDADRRRAGSENSFESRDNGFSRRPADQVGQLWVAQRQRRQRQIKVDADDMNESEGHSLTGAKAPKWAKSRGPSGSAVDKPLLSLPGAFGHRPAVEQAGSGRLRDLEQDRILLDSQRNGVARDRIENEKLVRLNRSLHAAWRDAVRTPWRNLRRRLRDALPVSSEGVPVAARRSDKSDCCSL